MFVISEDFPYILAYHSFEPIWLQDLARRAEAEDPALYLIQASSLKSEIQAAIPILLDLLAFVPNLLCTHRAQPGEILTFAV